MERPDALIRLLPPCLHWSPDGEVRVVDHRISLYRLITDYNEGSDAEALAAGYPTLESATIREVLAFYLDHRAEVDAYLADVQAVIDAYRAAYRPGPGVLRIRKMMEERQRTGGRS